MPTYHELEGKVLDEIYEKNIRPANNPEVVTAALKQVVRALLLEKVKGFDGRNAVAKAEEELKKAYLVPENVAPEGHIIFINESAGACVNRVREIISNEVGRKSFRRPKPDMEYKLKFEDFAQLRQERIGKARNPEVIGPAFDKAVDALLLERVPSLNSKRMIIEAETALRKAYVDPINVADDGSILFINETASACMQDIRRFIDDKLGKFTSRADDTPHAGMMVS